MKPYKNNICYRIFLGLLLINYITPLWSQNVVISNFEEWDSVSVFELPLGWVPRSLDETCPHNVAKSSDSYQENYSLELGDRCISDIAHRYLIWHTTIENIYSKDLISLNFFYKLFLADEFFGEKKGCIYIYARCRYGEVDNFEHRFWCIEKEEDVSDWTLAQFDFDLVKEDTIESIWVQVYCGFCDTGVETVGGSVCNIDSMYFALETSTNTQDFSIPETLIHPNPTQGFVNLQSSDRVSYSVHNFKGEPIVRSNLLERHHMIDLAEFPSGVYFVSLFDAEKVFLGSRKVVKY